MSRETYRQCREEQRQQEKAAKSKRRRTPRCTQLASEDLVPWGHPAAEKARHLAHTLTFGDNKNVLLVCTDAVQRHLLIVALLQWCQQQGWGCHEFKPGEFHLRRGTLYVSDELSPTLRGKVVHVETFNGTAEEDS